MRRTALTATLAAGILLVGGAGVAAASSVGGQSGPPDKVNSANDSGTIWLCYKDGAAPYVQFRGEPNGCSGTSGYTQLAVSPQNVGISKIEQDGNKITFTYLDGTPKTVTVPKGEKGDPGKDGVAGYEVIGRGTDNTTVPADGKPVTIKTQCDSHGERALSGGVRNTNPNVVVNGTKPIVDPTPVSPTGTPGDEAGRWVATGWQTTVTNKGANDVSLQPYVVCANVDVTPTDVNDSGGQ